jgi:predicted DNA binding CopG/RHH family protein
MEGSMNASKIPKTDSIEELARFWDQHDLTDFKDELEEVSEPVFERETFVKVALPAEVAQSVKELAESKGLDDATLIRQWVLDRVHAD